MTKFHFEGKPIVFERAFINAACRKLNMNTNHAGNILLNKYTAMLGHAPHAISFPKNVWL